MQKIERIYPKTEVGEKPKARERESNSEEKTREENFEE